MTKAELWVLNRVTEARMNAVPGCTCEMCAIVWLADALDSIPAQIGAAIQAEREACADVADRWARMAPFEYERVRDAEAIRNLILARGEATRG